MFDSNVDVNHLQTTDEDIFDRINVNIIDFGFATPYLSKGTREHIQKHIIDTYRGNFYFSSINQLRYRSTSRRDDLISLFYLIVYLFSHGRVIGLKLTPADPTPAERLV